MFGCSSTFRKDQKDMMLGHKAQRFLCCCFHPFFDASTRAFWLLISAKLFGLKVSTRSDAIASCWWVSQHLDGLLVGLPWEDFRADFREEGGVGKDFCGHVPLHGWGNKKDPLTEAVPRWCRSESLGKQDEASHPIRGGAGCAFGQLNKLSGRLGNSQILRQEFQHKIFCPFRPFSVPVFLLPGAVFPVQHSFEMSAQLIVFACCLLRGSFCLFCTLFLRMSGA